MAGTQLSSSNLNPPTIELPAEIQRIIFETAAQLDGRCAYRLVLVAKYVQEWINPILYERIVIRDPKSAVCLLQHSLAHDLIHLSSLAKSLTLDKQIQRTLIRPLFANLSNSIISLTIFRNIIDTDHHLSYIRSPSITHLTLVYHNVRRTGIEIPHVITSSLSHLTLISNTTYGGFTMSRSFATASAMQRNDTTWLNTSTNPTHPFHRLTFIALSYERWMEMFRVLTLARELKCLAILLPTNSSMLTIIQSVSAIRITADPRVVVLTHHGHPMDWSTDQGFAPSDFWTNIEDLARKRYICDDGERWEELIISEFRARHPEISLVGD